MTPPQILSWLWAWYYSCSLLTCYIQVENCCGVIQPSDFTFIARAVCMPRGLHVWLALISFFISFNDPLRQIISGSAGPIFTRFSPFGRYLVVHNWADPLLSISQGMLPWQPILWSKWAQSAGSLPFVASAFRNRVQYYTFDFKTFMWDVLATLYANRVEIGPVTPEFKKLIGIDPVFDKQFGNAISKIYCRSSLMSPLSTTCNFSSFTVHNLQNF